MPATTPSALGLLEIIALLFPVVALLLQLQHRTADSERVERFGLVAGIGLFASLSLSFVLVFVHVVVTDQPVLLVLALAFMTITSLLLPILVAFASEEMIETVLDVFAFDRSRYDSRLRQPGSPETSRNEENDDQN